MSATDRPETSTASSTAGEPVVPVSQSSFGKESPVTASGHSHSSSTAQRVAWAAAILLGVLVTVNAWVTTRHLDQTSRHNREHLFWTLCHTGGTADQRREAMLQLIEEGNTVWAAARLEHLDLEELDLSGTYLAAATLDGSKLAGARLANIDLNRSSLQTVDLSRANLRGALLEEILALKAIMNEADLREAQLRAASLEQVSAQKANFLRADLSDAYLYMADLTGATLTSAVLSGANLEAAVLRDANLFLAQLDGTRLVDADFTGSNWWRARGLTSEQIAELTVKFAPGEEAPDSRRADFDRWLKTLSAPAPGKRE